MERGTGGQGQRRGFGQDVFYEGNKKKKAEEGLPLNFNAVLPSPIKIEAE